MFLPAPVYTTFEDSSLIVSTALDGVILKGTDAVGTSHARVG